jgi:cellulose biosynthesis protein BcsQ
MLFACWSVKGGSGTTVVAASLALLLSRSSSDGVLLIDAAGDLPAALGVPDDDALGLADWLVADDPGPGALGRLELDVSPGLRLIPWHGPSFASDTWGGLDRLLVALAAEPRPVVVDCGSSPTPLALALAGAASLSLLVLRPCYLALRRALAAPVRPSGVVLIMEPARTLTPDDVEDALGVPVRARIPWSEGVARAVDAGLLAGRLPRALTRSLETAA